MWAKLMILKRQNGDTIVEVIISIAIVGLMLTTAYAITSRNNRSLVDAQERGQALKLVETQIEMLRSAGSFDPGTAKCFSGGSPTNTAADCKLTSNGSKAATGDVAFTLSITGSNPYVIVAQWDSIISGVSNVTVYYRP